MTSIANNGSKEFSKNNEIIGVYSNYKSNGTVTFCSVKKLCDRWLCDVDLAITIVLHL